MDTSNECEIILLYRFLGKKWTVELFNRITTDPISFNQLNKLTNYMISPRLLSKRLNGMEKFKLINKKKDGRILYDLSDKGAQLKKIMHLIKYLAMESNYKIPDCCKGKSCDCEIIFQKKNLAR